MLFKAPVAAVWTFSTVLEWCPMRWVLSLGNKKNRTKPRKGCTVGGEALWYYFEPKIPTHWTNSSGPVSHKFSHVQIFRNDSVDVRFGSPTSSAINRTFKRRSISRKAFTWATLFSVLEAEGRPARCSSSTLSLLFLNGMCHLKTWDEDQIASLTSSKTATFRNQIFRVSLRT